MSTGGIDALFQEMNWLHENGEDHVDDDGRPRDLHTPELVTLSPSPTMDDNCDWGTEGDVWMRESVEIPEPSSTKADPPHPPHSGSPQAGPSSTATKPASTTEIQAVLKKQKKKLGFAAPPKPAKIKPSSCERCKLIKNMFSHGMKKNSMLLCEEEILPFTEECFARKSCKTCKKMFNVMKA